MKKGFKDCTQCQDYKLQCQNLLDLLRTTINITKQDNSLTRQIEQKWYTQYPQTLNLIPEHLHRRMKQQTLQRLNSEKRKIMIGNKNL